MNSYDQLKLDHLYHSIYVQKLRYNTFNTIKTSSGVWNTSATEKKVLEGLLNTYKKYYFTKITELKEKITEEKKHNTESYLTYDPEFYINKFKISIEEINKYTVKLEKINIDNFYLTDLSIISNNFSLSHPDFLLKPNLDYKFDKFD
jgi:hypothetical protein